jgi:phosphate transport system protein
MRKTFHEELKDLKREVIEVGYLVKEAIQRAVESLIKSDVELAKKVMQDDDLIDRKVLEIEEKGVSLIATQCPVAKDLRLIHSIFLINIHLERMGDLAFNISRSVRDMGEVPVEGKEFVELLKKMGEKVLKLVEVSLKAFETSDAQLVDQLTQLDEPVDSFFKDFFKLLARQAGGLSFEWASNCILVCRWLERIADHAVDIGERVIYLVSGEFVDLD